MYAPGMKQAGHDCHKIWDFRGKEGSCHGLQGEDTGSMTL